MKTMTKNKIIINRTVKNSYKLLKIVKNVKNVSFVN